MGGRISIQYRGTDRGEGWWLVVVSRLEECGGAEACKTVCATRARGMGRVGLTLRAEYAGDIERMGRLLIQVAGNW